MTNQQISKVLYSLVKKQEENAWNNVIDWEKEVAEAIRNKEENTTDFQDVYQEELNVAIDGLKHHKQLLSQWEEILEFLVNKIIEQ